MCYFRFKEKKNKLTKIKKTEFILINPERKQKSFYSHIIKKKIGKFMDKIFIKGNKIVQSHCT